MKNLKKLTANAIKANEFNFSPGRDKHNVNLGCGDWSFDVDDTKNVIVSVHYRTSGGQIRTSEVGNFKLA